jgi:hypothetical protein
MTGIVRRDYATGKDALYMLRRMSDWLRLRYGAGRQEWGIEYFRDCDHLLEIPKVARDVKVSGTLHADYRLCYYNYAGGVDDHGEYRRGYIYRLAVEVPDELIAVEMMLTI